MKKQLSVQDKALLAMIEAVKEVIKRNQKEKWPFDQKSTEHA